ncbi:MAG TPA: sialidase family protein, partial [Gammaproteobacteria bacterium]|nr:sialidase family protein [Gammaproteobacteria bacterium]
MATRFWYRSLIFTSLLVTATVTLSSAHPISEKGRRSISPEIAVGSDGALNVIWIDKGLTVNRPLPKPRKPGEHSHRSATDLYFSRSEDGAKTWSQPIKINDQSGEVWGFSVSKPLIKVGPNGTIHIFYPANGRSEATGLDVVNARYSHSRDNGKSFSPPITINRPVTQDRGDLLGQGLTMSNSFGTMGVAPNGTIFTAWQNIVNMKDASDGADGMLAISTDDGESFSTERAVIP